MKNKMKLAFLTVLIFALYNNCAVEHEQNMPSEEPVACQQCPEQEMPEQNFDTEFDGDDFLDNLAADDCVKKVPHQEQKISYNLETVQLAALYLWHVYLVNPYCSCKNWITNFLTFKTSK
jgi:hypothetical protein